ISGCSGSGKEQVTQCAIGLADGDEIRVQPVIALRIIETATVEPQYLAASAFQYGLCRSRIPLAGGGKARIQISPALGQNAELQGAADSRQLDVMPALEPVQQGFLIRAAVPAAGDHAQGAGRGAGMDRLGGLPACLAPGAQPGTAPVELVP